MAYVAFVSANVNKPQLCNGQSFLIKKQDVWDQRKFVTALSIEGFSFL